MRSGETPGPSIGQRGERPLAELVKAKVQPRGRKTAGDVKKRKLVLTKLRGRAPAAETSRRARQVETKKTAILDAALQTFSRYGLHGATVEQIAEAADQPTARIDKYWLRFAKRKLKLLL